MYGSKHRTTDGFHDNRQDSGAYSSSKRECNIPKYGSNDDSTNHPKYFRTQSSSNNRSVPSLSSQQQRQNGDKEKKTVKDAKKPIRVSGDWSEFRSSTGKNYFYNSKTEVSQWEKPKGWPSDSNFSTRPSSSSTSADRPKKDSSTIRPRHKMDQPRSQSKDFDSLSMKVENDEFSNDIQPILNTSINRLPSPNDDSSRMSFSSTSSQESSSLAAAGNGSKLNGVLFHSSISEPAIPVSTPVSDIPLKSFEKVSTPINGKKEFLRSNTTESIQSMEIETNGSTVSKAERDQEIHKYYRADLIQHLTDWSSTQFEKQCLKLFDEYYNCTAKMSSAFTELKSFKSNLRVLNIKRNIVTQRLCRCQQHLNERDNYQLS